MCLEIRLVFRVAALAMTVPAFGISSPAAESNPDWPNGPDDDPRAATPDDPNFAGMWQLRSYIPDSCLPTIRPEEIPLGAGISADRAWQVATGSPNVVIAGFDPARRVGRLRIEPEHFRQSFR